MKKTLLAALVLLIAGCDPYWYERDERHHDRDYHRHDERRAPHDRRSSDQRMHHDNTKYPVNNW